MLWNKLKFASPLIRKVYSPFRANFSNEACQSFYYRSFKNLGVMSTEKKFNMSTILTDIWKQLNFTSLDGMKETGVSITNVDGIKKYFNCYVDMKNLLAAGMSSTSPFKFEEFLPVKIVTNFPYGKEEVNVNISFSDVNSLRESPESILIKNYKILKPDSTIKFLTPISEDDLLSAHQTPITAIAGLSLPLQPQDDVDQENFYLEYINRAQTLSKSLYICSLKDYLLTDSNKNGKGRKSNTFSCFILPSMTGKTQLALSLGYGAFYFNLKNESQPIYQPFRKASNQLLKCAAKDLELMKAAGVLEGEFATKSQIEEYLDSGNHSSFLLGYLKAILERAIAKGECDIPSWLKLCREARFSEIFPCRFSDLPDFRHKFMICLDEFPSYGENGWKEAIFIRNTLRYLNFSCLLLGTNTKIANLAGLNSGSGTGIFPWCSFFFDIKFDKDCRMNLKDNFFTLFNMHLDTLGIDKKVASLIRNNLDLEYSVFLSFLESELGADFVHLSFLKLLKFLYDQVNTSRPGIASFINDGLRQINPSETTFLEVSRDLLVTVGLKMLFRKGTLESFNAACGHMALMLSSSGDSNSVLGLMTSILVNDHLFYLIPSSMISNSTSADRIISKDESIYIGDDEVPSGVRAHIINHPDGSSKRNLASLKIKSQKDFEDFTTMISYGIPPPSEEFFTYIISFGGVCYGNSSLKRIPGESSLTKKVKSTFDMSTPETNIFENSADGKKIGRWNKVENLCIVWASNASHFKLLEERTNSCVDFLNNLLNCFQPSEEVWISENSANDKSMKNITAFLSKFSVPYLGPLNTQWPSAINDLYKNRFGLIERIGDNDFVDFQFQLFDDDGNDYIATAEVKFREEKTGGDGDSKIETIITKSVMHVTGIKVPQVKNKEADGGKKKGFNYSSYEKLCDLAGSDAELKKPPLNIIFCKNHIGVKFLRKNENLQSYLSKIKYSLLFANMKTKKIEYIGGASSPIDGVCIIIPIYKENEGFMDFVWNSKTK